MNFKTFISPHILLSKFYLFMQSTQSSISGHLLSPLIQRIINSSFQPEFAFLSWGSLWNWVFLGLTFWYLPDPPGGMKNINTCRKSNATLPEASENRLVSFFFMVFLFLFLFFFNFLFGTVIINLNRKLLTKYINEQNLGVLNGGTRVKIQPSLP